MSYVGNSPEAETILRVEARKSFALGLRIKDKNGNALDISNATFRIVVKKVPSRTGDPADDDNLVENAQAAIIDGRRPHSILLEVFTDEGIGTEVIPG